MADTANAPSSAPDGTTQKARAEKPDETKYKADVAQAEKDHAAAQEKPVSVHLI